MMYDELVKALRGCVLSKPCAGCPYYDPNGPTKECATMNIAAADAIEELSKPKWIPVTERLPEEETPVQVTYLGYYDKKPRTDMIACLYCGYWCYWDGAPCNYGKCNVEVTHWMPLPQPPKEE